MIQVKDGHLSYAHFVPEFLAHIDIVRLYSRKTIKIEGLDSRQNYYKRSLVVEEL